MAEKKAAAAKAAEKKAAETKALEAPPRRLPTPPLTMGPGETAPRRKVTFASHEAAELYIEHGVHPAILLTHPPSGEGGGYTTDDVEAAIEGPYVEPEED